MSDGEQTARAIVGVGGSDVIRARNLCQAVCRIVSVTEIATCSQQYTTGSEYNLSNLLLNLELSREWINYHFKNTTDRIVTIIPDSPF